MFVDCGFVIKYVRNGKTKNRQHRFVIQSREFRHSEEIKSIEIIFVYGWVNIAAHIYGRMKMRSK